MSTITSKCLKELHELLPFARIKELLWRIELEHKCLVQDKKEPKLVLQLYHGREDPTQHMDEWGTEGPRLEILSFIDTYRGKADVIVPGEPYTERHSLCIHEDLIFYDGIFYGDMQVMISDDADEVYDAAKASITALDACLANATSHT
jgi:hypothetical protein